jgi:hypothetical protein
LKDFIEPPPEEGVDEEFPRAPDTENQDDAAGTGTGESTAGAEGPPAGEQDDDTVEQGSVGEPESRGAPVAPEPGEEPDASEQR